MKLHGIAVAAIPKSDDVKSDDKYVYDITCTTIAVDEKTREQFDIIDKGKKDSKHTFKTTVDLKDTKSTMECFEKLVGALSAAVKRQEIHCPEGQKCQPVVVQIGQDGRHPINVNDPFLRLFGKPFGGYRWRVNVNDVEIVSQFTTDRPQMQKLHNQDLAEHSKSESFVTAARTLSALKDRFTLTNGNFHYLSGEVPHITTMSPDEFDSNIAALKKMYDEGDDAEKKWVHNEFVRRARGLGQFYGRSQEKTPYCFGLVAPKGYLARDYPHLPLEAAEQEAKKWQEKLPGDAFFHWHPDYKAAFHDGFKETYKGKRNIRFKLPLDNDNPPFTDPLFHAILDRFDLAEGKFTEKELAEELPFDYPKTRELLAECALSLAKHDHPRVNPAANKPFPSPR